MNPKIVLAILSEAIALEPIAFSLVAKLVQGLKGKTDAEVLAGDANDWAAIVALAHAEADPTAPPASK